MFGLFAFPVTRCRRISTGVCAYDSSSVDVGGWHQNNIERFGQHVRVVEGVVKAAKLGRTVRFGIRLHVIVRETNEEAWKAADKLISHLDDDTIARAQASLSRFDSVGQQRMAALHGGSRDNLEVSPNLWAGVGLVRGGAGTALVGDGPTVAARVKEYADLGIATFIFSGYPTWKSRTAWLNCCSRTWTSSARNCRKAQAM